MTEREFLMVPANADGHLKHDVMDILVHWSSGMIGTGVAYEQIVSRAAMDVPTETDGSN